VSSNGPSGSFNGGGYIAYRITGTDTTYGWIRVTRNVNSGSQLTIHEFAFRTIYTGTDENSKNFYHPVFRPAGHNLFIDLPDKEFNESCLIDCYDLTGRLVFQTKPVPGTNICNFSGYENGIYIIKICGHSYKFASFAF